VTALQEAILRKARESCEVKQAFFAEHAARIEVCAAAMAESFARGAMLFAFGNGGSACDAQHVSVEFMHPIFEKRSPLPAIALPCDMALMTAKGNDRDYSMTFVEQLRVLAKKGDIAVGISTSGKSANVNRALAAAREMGLLSVGFAGRDGGRMPGLCDHCFVVPSFSIHRIQEVQETLLHVLWDAIHILRGEEDVL
jgi:D-sedoheptulose 7-phosphate isomerase